PYHLTLFVEDLQQYPIREDVTPHLVGEWVTMDSSVREGIRQRKSSLAEGIRCLKERAIDIFITTGHTAVLVIEARRILKKEGPIALMTSLPTANKQVIFLDVGAMLSRSTQDYVGLAKVGISAQQKRGIPHPRVGLLNIGREVARGPIYLKKAHAALHREIQSNYIGSVEGNDLFLGKADVIVTDGFTGNVVIKTAEGIGQILEVNTPSHHNQGATLCGFSEAIMKCHGRASPPAIASAINEAITYLYTPK
ncbi:MAG: hypothetical protein VXZ72_03885, partial [Chlamydiota bacterium]|nr:hypothetical protein [Chlamydiota bacterium]